MCLCGESYVRTKDQLALLNTSVTLECSIINANDSIFIVRWQKNGTNGVLHNVATVNAHRSSIFSGYKEKVNVTQDKMKSSSLNIFNITKNDSGCFVCSFYCGRSSNCSNFLNTTCLTVYVPLIAYIAKSNGSEESNITCTATSYPLPTVTWIGITNVINETRTTSNENGTLSVESTLMPKTEESYTNVTCEVKYLGNVTRIPWNSSKTPVFIGIFIIVVVVIILVYHHYYIRRRPSNLIKIDF
uniref:Glycoprotein vOX2-2 n=1 Tax=Elephant endotheliotropic herpesvirus 1B TaxID=759754 RepID=A0A386AU74_ELHV1|nr:glycoprotein vOX2-2 [Elephant endotheliotropic herpesvirus 1B]AYC62835.1 glycoprotein vOX2-2 [Elephant endotheliotropic herpesvirus 1B]